MELDHSSSPLIELALSSCIPFHPHDKRQKCWTRDAELSQVKASGPTCHTSKLIKRCHVAIIWFASSLPSESSSCARLIRQSFANVDFALEKMTPRKHLYRIYGHVAAESAQKLIPFSKGMKNFAGDCFGNLWQHTATTVLRIFLQCPRYHYRSRQRVYTSVMNFTISYDSH